MGPEGARNQEWLHVRGAAAIFGLVMCSVGFGKKNLCAGDGQRQFAGQDLNKLDIS
jgi:hypothetical protein